MRSPDSCEVFVFLAFAILGLLAAVPAHAQFSASPSSLALPNANNPDNPNIAFFTLSSAIPASTPFALTTNTTSGGNWLSAASLFGSTTAAQIQVTVTASGLAAGSYSGSVIVSSPAGSLPEMVVPVTLQVATGSGSTFSVSPLALTFEYATGQAPPLSQTVSLISTIATSYSTTVWTNTGANWLSVSPSAGGPASSFLLSVAVNPLVVSTGSYAGTVTIFAAGQSQVIQVILNVNQPGNGVNPSSLNFSYRIGGTFPAAQSVFYRSPTAVTLIALTTYTSANGAGWLSVNQFSGVTRQAILTVRVSPTGLPAGIYTGTVLVIPSTGTTLTVSVTLVVSGGTGGVTVTPSALQFAYTIGGGFPTQGSLTFASTTGAPYSVSVTSSGGNWLLGPPGGGDGTPGFISVGINVPVVAVMTPGSYLGQVQLSVSGLPAVTVPVFLVISPAGAQGGEITLNSSPLLFNYTGDVNPSVQNVTMTAPPGLAYATSALSTNGWLTVTPASSAAGGAQNPENLKVGLNTQRVSTLANGTYAGLVTVDFSPQPYVAATLLVTLVVAQNGPSLIVSPSSLVFTYVSGLSGPSSQTFTLTAFSPTTFTATATGAALGINWLSVGPSASTNAAAMSIFSVGVLPRNLPYGSYTGTVLVQTPLGSASVNVTLNVVASSIAVNPTQLSFNYQLGGALPEAQFLSLNTLNVGSSTFTLSTIPLRNWLDVTPSSGSVPGVIAVKIKPQNLPAGTYTGSVNILFSGLATPVDVPISLTVTAGPVLRLSPNAATFNYQIGGSALLEQSQIVDLSSSGSDLNVNITAQIASPFGGTWLRVSQQAARTPAAVSVGINAANLASGTYTGNVLFTVAGQPAISLPVTLNVRKAMLGLSGLFAFGSASELGLAENCACAGTAASNPRMANARNTKTSQESGDLITPSGHWDVR